MRIHTHIEKFSQQKMPPLGIEPKTSGLLRSGPEEVVPDFSLGRLGNRTFVRNVCSVEVFTSGTSVTHRFLGGSVVCNQRDDCLFMRPALYRLSYRSIGFFRGCQVGGLLALCSREVKEVMM